MKRQAEPFVDPESGCVRFNNEYCTGLNVALRCAYYPMYTYKTATLVTEHPYSRLVIPIDMTLHLEVLPKNPKRRGKMLDRCVNKMVLLAKQNVSLLALISKEPFKSNDKHLVAEVRGFHKSCISYVKHQLIPYLIENGLEPLESQYPVANAKARVGTAIDLVCRDPTGSYVILENKLGFEAYYNTHTQHKMCAPFQQLDDSPYNQHQLYLLLAISMFEQQRNVKVNRNLSGVLRMSQRGLWEYSLMECSSDKLIQAWDRIIQQHDLNHKQRLEFIRLKKRQKIQTV